MTILRKGQAVKLFALLLLLLFTAVLLYGSFLAVPFGPQPADASRGSAPFSLSGSGTAAADCILISALRQMTENRSGRDLVLPQLLSSPAIRLAIQKNYRCFYITYLLEFLSILLFVIILSFWKNKKDGKKGRSVPLILNFFTVQIKEELS